MKPLSLDDLTVLVVKLHQLLESQGDDPAEIQVFTESSSDTYCSRYQLCDVLLVGGRVGGTVKVLLKEMMT